MQNPSKTNNIWTEESFWGLVFKYYIYNFVNDTNKTFNKIKISVKNIYEGFVFHKRLN